MDQHAHSVAHGGMSNPCARWECSSYVRETWIAALGGGKSLNPGYVCKHCMAKLRASDLKLTAGALAVLAAQHSSAERL